MIAPTAATPVWHERLRRFSPAAAGALCEIFSERGTITPQGEPVTTWTFQPSTSFTMPAAILRGVQEELWISLREDGLCERLGHREWWDYDSEARVLAWTLAHRVLVESLGKLLREAVFPIAWSDGQRQPPQDAQNVVLAFSIVAADGRSSTGQLGLSPAMTARLATAVGWQRHPMSDDEWNALPVTTRIELRGPPMPLAELIPTRTGDVLVLGRRTRCWRALRVTCFSGTDLSGTDSATVLDAWTASYEEDRLQLTGAAHEIPTETTMQEQLSEETPVTAHASALAGVPVVLDFEVGSLSLPLGKIGALKPGYVLQLPMRLEEARVIIRANGVRIGHGELVAVGDVLGVQVLAIDPHGLR